VYFLWFKLNLHIKIACDILFQAGLLLMYFILFYRLITKLIYIL